MTKFPKHLATLQVKVDISFTEEQRSVLRKQINLHYLGDAECNVMTENGIVPKHPQKETKEYLDLMHRIIRTSEVRLPVMFFSDGSIKFGSVKDVAPTISDHIK